MVGYVCGYTYIEDEEGGRGRGGKERRRRSAPKGRRAWHRRGQRRTPPLPRSPYLGRSTPNAADTAYGRGKRGWKGGREIDSRWDAEGGFGEGGGLIWGQPREYPSSFCELIARPSAFPPSSPHPSKPPSIHDIVCSGSLDLSINLLSSLCAAPRIPTSDP